MIQHDQSPLVRDKSFSCYTFIFFSTHQVLEVSNCSKNEIAAAYSREKPMTLEVVDRLKDDTGKEHAGRHEYSEALGFYQA